MRHEKITHVDLFSGIGGFALAADRVFGSVDHTFCDSEPFAQAILTKNWPGSPIYGDIKALDATGFGPVDLLTGGFPCQPFSGAGKRRGARDDRDLWPEMFRVIRECRPAWIIGENVAGFVGMALERTASDLESEGYEVRAFIIPALAVGAPHRRDRVWIVAHFAGVRARRRGGEKRGVQKRELVKAQPQGGSFWSESQRRAGDLWLGTASRLCRMGNGVSLPMDRAPRLKALGNAIVPQVAEGIMTAILRAEA